MNSCSTRRITFGAMLFIAATITLPAVFASPAPTSAFEMSAGSEIQETTPSSANLTASLVLNFAPPATADLSQFTDLLLATERLGTADSPALVNEVNAGSDGKSSGTRVPEPSSLTLFGSTSISLLALFARARRK